MDIKGFFKSIINWFKTVFTKNRKDDIPNLQVSEVNWNIKITDKVESDIPYHIGKVYYHPNKNWHVDGKIYKKDTSIKYIQNRPHQGYFSYIDEETFTIDKNAWSNFLILNEMPNDVTISNHQWGAFITKYKTQYPEIVALYKGVRNSSKICVTNPLSVDLYVEYIKSIYKTNKEYYPIEPSDGLGFCECEDCSKLSHSQQVYGFANEVAKKIKPIYPDIKLSLYAYYTHADIPKDIEKLEDNICVLLAPEGFQTLYNHSDFIERWCEYHKGELMYRGYMGLAQWGMERPNSNIRKYVSGSKYFHEYNFTGMIIETGLSLNYVLMFMIMRKIWLNKNMTFNTAYHDLLDECFSESKKDIESVISSWWLTSYSTEINDINLVCIKRCIDYVKDINEKKRLLDMLAYCIYNKYLYEYFKNSTNPEYCDKLCNYLYRLGYRNLVNYKALLLTIASNIKKHDLTKYLHENGKMKDFVIKLTDEEVIKEYNKLDLSHLDYNIKFNLYEQNYTHQYKDWNNHTFKNKRLDLYKNGTYYVVCKDKIVFKLISTIPSGYINIRNYDDSINIKIDIKNGGYKKGDVIEFKLTDKWDTYTINNQGSTTIFEFENDVAILGNPSIICLYYNGQDFVEIQNALYIPKNFIQVALFK